MTAMQMSAGRWAATATALLDGRVLVAGGYSFAEKDTLRSADLFDPKTEGFTPAAPLRDDRNFATATRLSNGRVLVAGGFSEKRGTLSFAEIYDPLSDRWTPTQGEMNDCRELYTATSLPDGTILLAGGLSLKKRTTLNTAEIYAPASDTFTPTRATMRHDRFGHAATALADGRVLLLGGQSWKIGNPSDTLATAEVYDPKTGIFALTGSLLSARDRPTATRLHDGTVLIAGGTDRGKPPLDAERYDPATGTFHRVGSLSEGRMAHDACLLADGRVLVAGGWSDVQKATTPAVEVYDPTTNAWTRWPDLPFSAHDLVLLVLDGRILSVGGKSTQGDEATAYSVGQAAWLNQL
jgi:hypothetical protein